MAVAFISTGSRPCHTGSSGHKAKILHGDRSQNKPSRKHQERSPPPNRRNRDSNCGIQDCHSPQIYPATQFMASGSCFKIGIDLRERRRGGPARFGQVVVEILTLSSSEPAEEVGGGYETVPCRVASPSSREPRQSVNERVRPGIPRWPISRFLAVARIDRRLVGRRNEESPRERALLKLPGLDWMLRLSAASPLCVIRCVNSRSARPSPPERS